MAGFRSHREILSLLSSTQPRYLYDIQQSILSIEEYLGEKRDFIAYEQNKLLRRAVERELEIIGEAMALTLHEL